MFTLLVRVNEHEREQRDDEFGDERGDVKEKVPVRTAAAQLTHLEVVSMTDQNLS